MRFSDERYKYKQTERAHAEHDLMSRRFGSLSNGRLKKWSTDEKHVEYS